MKRLVLLFLVATSMCQAAAEADALTIQFVRALNRLRLELHGELYMPPANTPGGLEIQRRRLYQMQNDANQFPERSYPRDYFDGLVIGQRAIVNIMHRELHPEPETNNL